MSELFGRSYTLTVTAGTVSRSWRGLDLAFDVEQTDGSDPNRGDIQVWGLSKDSLRLISDSGATVRLAAGYATTEGIVFAGDIDEVEIIKDGPSILARLSCSDGGAAIRSTVANLSVATDTPKASLIDQALDLLGLPLGQVTQATGTAKNGAHQTGSVAKLLDILCGDAELRWNVQDGVAQVYPAAGTTEPVVILGVESGLVGVPQRVVQRDQAGGLTRKGIRCRSLLQPKIRPGRRIEVKSEWVPGRFVVERVKHVGSSFGGEWYTDLEAY